MVRRTSALAYAPALDGLRALCLFGVLLFHSGFSWMSGGFLGVSTFFTLSGFLITSLLVADWDTSGQIALGSFWMKRMRRLVPAALLTIGAVVGTSPLWLPLAQRERLTADALACLLYLVNWRFVSAAYAYSLIFIDPSPLQHFWSLAIEGQFYLVFPLLVGIALRVGRGPGLLAVALVALIGCSLLVSFAPRLGQEAEDRIYYGSDARASELLVGALLALALRRRDRPVGGVAAVLLQGAGLVALAAMALAWVRSDVDSTWLYRGGFAGYACLSALVIWAALAERGPVPNLLSPSWLRWVGRVSYGAYLYHWPIFLVMDERRTGLAAGALLAARVGLTLALAGLSYRYLEEPVRRGRVSGGALGWGAVTAAIGVAALAVLVSPVSVEVQTRLALRGLRDRQATGQAHAPGPEEEVRYGVFGDSTMMTLDAGLGLWLEDRGIERLPGYAPFGCGLLDQGYLKGANGWEPIPSWCRGMADRWREAATQSGTDLAIVLVGPWEVGTRQLEAGGDAMELGDPRLDDLMRRAIAAAIDQLSAAGASVVWLTSPRFRTPDRKGPMHADRDASRPERMSRLNELVREVVATRPDKARVVDLAAYLRGLPGGDLDPGLRSDGVHFSVEGAQRITRDWLGNEIVRAYRELAPERKLAFSAPWSRGVSRRAHAGAHRRPR